MFSTNAVVLDCIAKERPSYRITVEAFGYAKKLFWTDPNFTTPGKVDMMLPYDFYEKVVWEETKVNTEYLYARDTISGWVVFCEDPMGPSQYFHLPSHCIFNEDSTTKKLTLVFNPSGKRTLGSLINEVLMV